MILEVADIRITPGQNAAFDEAIRRGVETVIARSPGYLGYQVARGIESPERYLLTIRWETVDHHMKDFREGPLFPAWRAIVGPFFAAPPVVEHFEVAAPLA